MSDQPIFNILIVLHVSGGVLGLTGGTIAACVVKGKRGIFFYK